MAGFWTQGASFKFDQKISFLIDKRMSHPQVVYHAWTYGKAPPFLQLSHAAKIPASSF
jgi:hypothetical protein